MNSIIDQLRQDRLESEQEQISMALVAGYIRTWRDVDNNLHYELTEKGVKRLALLMV